MAIYGHVIGFVQMGWQAREELSHLSKNQTNQFLLIGMIVATDFTDSCVYLLRVV